jgi:hypothetical protein
MQTLHLIDEYLMQGGYTPGIDAETLEREAHLVAAAPDLLAALEYLLQQTIEADLQYSTPLSEGEQEAEAMARAAINKAKGD